MMEDKNRQTSNNQQKTKRLLELDVFRGIASLFVVLFHYTERYGQLYGHLYEPAVKISYGHYGVHLFFIISGFVIFLTLERTKNSLDFIVSRFSRLYPAYWAAILVTFLFVSFFGLPGRKLSLEHAVFNLTMLQSLFNVPSLDGVYWTLAVELKFYLIMFFLFISNNLKRINTAASIWLGLIIIDILLYKFFNLRFIGLLRTSLIFEHGSLFIAGIFFYKLKFGERGVLLHTLIWSGLIGIFIADGTEKTVVVFLYYILFYLFVYGHFSIIAKRSLIFLGTISYTLYLVHQNIGYIIINKFYKYSENTDVAIIIALVCSLSIATIITYSVEKPMLKIIRNYYKKNRTRYMKISVFFSKLWHNLATKR